MPTARPATARLTAAAAVLIAVLAACGGDDPEPLATSATPPPSATATASKSATPSPSATPADADVIVEIRLEDGLVITGEQKVQVKRGQSVLLVITSDRAEEVHVHGYELTAALKPGEQTTIRFDATKPGSWEVELHEASAVAVELEVAS